ncbi:MAG: MBL fold metallo-hydrolase [Deltaproteobacteria bacterium]|jgi:L-ascorbate metabolism protein UlaG (beta-lactamase superfamily)|nr:MBL fold metallo-hydrolase [Deltaproteobacteria bacterium]
MLLWLALAPVALALLLGAAGALYLRHPRFGALPEGERLARIERSPNWRDGEFRNLEPAREAGEEPGRRRGMLDFLFRGGRTAPQDPLPVVETDLKSLPDGEFVWFGHSSFLLALGGRTFLVDPVFGGSVSPVPFAVKTYRASRAYRPEELPDIDYVLLSHDHHDHVDHATLRSLMSRVGKVICGLGIGAHLERWGYPPGKILEGDWGDAFEPEPGVRVTLETARHFSGRGLKWNRSLWVSFVLEAGGRRVFYSGDGGYGRHFAELGRKWGGFDLAFLEDGQYDLAWKDIHLSPEETIQAALDLGAEATVPVHNSRYSISYHDWDDPLVRAREAARSRGVNLMTPLMGERVKVAGEERAFPAWWEGRR